MKYKVVGLERRRKLQLAIVLNQKDSKQEVYLEAGEKVKVSAEKTIWSSAEGIEANDAKTMKIGLATLRQKYFQEEVEMEMLWECLEADMEYNFTEMLELYYGDFTDREAGALFVHLSQDDRYFQFRNGNFTPVAAKILQANLRRKEIEEEKRNAEKNLIDCLKGQSKSIDLENQSIASLLDSFKKYALEGEEHCNSEGKRIGQLLGLDPDEALILLEGKNIIEKDINETLYRRQLPLKFTSEVIADSKEIMKQEFNFEERKNLSTLWNIAIDDADTEEVDDALSYHKEDIYDVIGVHIADVAGTIPSQGGLDKFARDQFATLYFPEGKQSLFPMELVQDRLTLAVEEPRKTISGFFYFNEDANLVKSSFERTSLSLQRRATYEETLSEIGNEPEFIKLQEIATKLRDKRVENGAIVTQFPELKIKVKEDSAISIQRVEMNTPGQLVVSEFMILFNSILGKKFMQEKIPAFYRVQNQKPKPITSTPEDPLYPLKVRWSLSGASLSMIPGPHYTLGVDVYTQGTSPIRRYSDLIMQRQLVASIEKKESPYTEESLQKIKSMIERSEKTVKTSEHERYIFWLYKHLKKNKGKVYQGVVSRVLERLRVMVYVPELLQEFPIKLEYKSDAQEGKFIKLKLQGASPRKRRVHWLKIQNR